MGKHSLRGRVSPNHLHILPSERRLWRLSYRTLRRNRVIHLVVSLIYYCPLLRHLLHCSLHSPVLWWLRLNYNLLSHRYGFDHRWRTLNLVLEHHSLIVPADNLRRKVFRILVLFFKLLLDFTDASTSGMR